MQVLPTSQLRRGDLVMLYGATYQLREDARVVGPPRPEYPGESPCYGARGDLARGCDFLRRESWWFQGNDLARWAVWRAEPLSVAERASLARAVEFGAQISRDIAEELTRPSGVDAFEHSLSIRAAFRVMALEAADA